MATETHLSLSACETLDTQDPLRELRQHFSLPEGVIYLDGNSLGALPAATAGTLAHTVTEEWGKGLIGSWNHAGWFELPQRLGDRLARWIGAAPGEVVVTDGTSINLYKVLFAAISIAKKSYADCRNSQKSCKNIILTERDSFPTDLYIAQGLCAQHGFELRCVEAEELAPALTPDVAVLLLTHVNYRTGAMHDMAAVTAAAHAIGALAVWDLAHSAGAVPVDLNAANADFAVGCTYKYLNGGPGAPAFLWVHTRHVDAFNQPLSGWWGHADPFAFTLDYRPAAGVARYLCGTQPVLGLRAVACGLDVFDACLPLGGMDALRRKSLALTDAFIELVHQRCAGHGLALVTPRAALARGSQVSLTRRDPHDPTAPTGAYAIVQALIARGVVGDFRRGSGASHPDIMRFGFTPLYTRYTDVWHAVEHLRQVLELGEWRQPQFQGGHAVT